MEDAAVFDDALESEDGAVPVLAAGEVVPASADGGVVLLAALAASDVVFAGVPEVAFVPLASVGGVDGGAGVWDAF